MTFPILRLPFLALKVVITCGEEVESLKLSLCSRRVDRIIKICKRNPSIFSVYYNDKRFNHLEKIQLLLSEAQHSNIKEKFGIGITHLNIRISGVFSMYFYVQPDIEFTINIDYMSQMEKYNGCRKTLEFAEKSVPSIFYNNQVYTFWNDRVYGLQFLVEYFEKNFRLRRFSSAEFKNSVPDLKNLVNYLNTLPNRSDESNGVYMRAVFVGHDAKLSCSDYKYLLETVIHPLHGCMETSEDFKFIGRFATQRLVLTSAHWFNLEHLLESKCLYVQVEGSEFTNVHLRVFMEKWSTGKLAHFKNVRVAMKEELDFAIVLTGIKIIHVPQRNPERNVLGNPPYRISRSIRGESGEQATVESTRFQFTFEKLHD